MSWIHGGDGGGVRKMKWQFATSLAPIQVVIHKIRKFGSADGCGFENSYVSLQAVVALLLLLFFPVSVTGGALVDSY